MQPGHRLLTGPKIAACLLILALSSVAHASNFVRVSIGRGASMEVPKNWVVLSGSSRVTIDAFVEAQGMKRSRSALPFAANLFDANGNTVALVNVRFYPDNELTQVDAAAATQAELDALLPVLVDQNQKAIVALGQRVVGPRGISKRTVGGVIFIVHEHERTGDRGNVRVRGVRIWRSPSSFTVTLNYREKDALLMRPIIEYMTNSIRVR